MLVMVQGNWLICMLLQGMKNGTTKWSGNFSTSTTAFLVIHLRETKSYIRTNNLYATVYGGFICIAPHRELAQMSFNW